MYGHEDPARVVDRPNLQPIVEERSKLTPPFYINNNNYYCILS